MAVTLSESFVAEPPPLRWDAGGVVRVGSTRVTLDTVVGAWNDGASVEEIVAGYDSLRLADVHAAISFYLRHREDVEAYLSRRREEAGEARREVETQCPPTEFRARLLARQQSKVLS